MSLAIAIPTRGRKHQRTWERLEAAGLSDQAYIVTGEADLEHLRADYGKANLVQVPDEVPKGVGHKRQWMIDTLAAQLGHRHLLMMDDDLKFYARKDPNDWHMRNATDEDMHAIVETFRTLCTETSSPLIALSARQGNQHYTKPLHYNKRACTVYAVDTRFLNENNIRFDRLPLMEDFDVALQILRRGRETTMIAAYAWGQEASNQAGGCSIYRTPELQAECSERLAALHPEFVTVVEKKMKTGNETWKMRKDVRVQWQRAYEAGLAELAK